MSNGLTTTDFAPAASATVLTKSIEAPMSVPLCIHEEGGPAGGPVTISLSQVWESAAEHQMLKAKINELKGIFMSSLSVERVSACQKKSRFCIL